MPDLVDCERLAEGAEVLERVYGMSELTRVQDVLAEPRGELRASFAFARAASGRAMVRVEIHAVPQLVCQRCMQGFAFPVSTGSEVEFASDQAARASHAEREFFRIDTGMVSLRELAEEELLLALPIAAACGTPQSCGNAPSIAAKEERSAGSEEMRRPFSALRDMLKRT